MTISPARNASLLLFSFILIVGILFAGAWFYKYSSTSLYSTGTSQFVGNSIVPVESSISLYLVPTGNTNEYSLVLRDLKNPVTTVAFQITSTNVSTPISGSSIVTNSSLANSGWTTAINSESSSDSLQRLSYTLIRTTPAGSDTTPEMTLGTITLSGNSNINQLELNPEESFLTYSNDENPVRIVLETNGN